MDILAVSPSLVLTEDWGLTKLAVTQYGLLEPRGRSFKKSHVFMGGQAPGASWPSTGTSTNEYTTASLNY